VLKNKLNIFLLVSFLLAVSITVWLDYKVKDNVGDIAFNDKIDNPDFKVCNENNIFQYYSSKSNYQNGRKEIEKELHETIKELTFEKSGLITFRFIINCNGETGRFRLKGVNTELKDTKFDSEKLQILQNAVQNLKNWRIVTYNNKTNDSYFVLNFKVEQCKITDVF